MNHKYKIGSPVASFKITIQEKLILKVDKIQYIQNIMSMRFNVKSLVGYFSEMFLY